MLTYVIWQLPLNSPNIYKSIDKEKKEINIHDYVRTWVDHASTAKNDYDFCEDLFWGFNNEKPANFAGHSLSVSDVIELIDESTRESRFYYCSRIGFTKVVHKDKEDKED